jgi:hypothetical protein
MATLQYRQQKIQEKRKQTQWKEFLLEFASRFPLVLQKDGQHISRYPSKGRWFNLYYNNDIDVWLWNAFDSSQNIFIQIYNLFSSSPKLGNLNFPNSENCQYSEWVYGWKNCYLSIDVGEGVENILYSSIVLINCKNVISSININNNCENIFCCKNITSCFNIFYSKYLHSCNNIRFSSNLIGCNECLFCNDLQNHSYCIYNKQLEKEEYFKQKLVILENKNQFNLHLASITTAPFIRNSNEVTWWWLTHCTDIQEWYFLTRFVHGKNVMLWEWWNQSTNCYDCFYVWTNAQDYYAMVSSGIDSSQCYCSVWITRSQNIYYSYYLDNCSFCLGCIGLKNKSYCILNKQYSKEERYEKVDEIFAQMDADGTLGDFFPATMNPFYFNDTAAYLIDPSFTKEEVIAKWYLRRDEPIKVDIPEGMEIVKTSELWQYEWFDTAWNRTINADILKKIIQDEQGNVYRIVKMEYEFLVKHGLPIPRKHWLERMKENFRIN